ncbi:hypothetical protein SARC_07829 [Sphaeroforma arctica JP610]|uniref:DNA topoisomerase 2 n=1 Tax=Sphaeroforma arctica JP610 TaxID=667725 RepID=A0A0L0FV23_9EUKA|nr:hypothetical protein SARC_07829 [Sphaeroforma arctica JP610]KNC79788.1 hypothetical protein SARC_07829 [Sphaeroforma arctica JP610]|eukprot:XP_014153690.1 hypothetical protein SARC_07829 [Sphaeroforma arctica JP610]
MADWDYGEDDIMDHGVLAPLNTVKKAPRPAGKKTIEETYQKKTQLEHILLRPDSYIGSTEASTEQMWVYDQGTGMVFRKVTYVPGLFKIFDEILVNAADNRQRDKNMNTMKIDVDVENNSVKIWNNGAGIPIEMHKDENVYVPELIFGHLLTSSNYNDTEKKVTGGRNGYGAKLCNIFSEEFTIETASKATGEKYTQSFTRNMSNIGKAKIRTPAAGIKEDYTCITFKPDLGRFGMQHLDVDVVALFTKRAYDMAGCLPGVKVIYNGSKLPCKSFKEYVKMYIENNRTEEGLPLPLVHEIVNNRWEVLVTTSEGQFQQMSFVNSICTSKGGQHVNHVTDQLTTKIIEVVKKKNKAAPVKPFQIKNHLWVFVNALIENPSFDSQTKENMTLRKSMFGSECTLSDKFVKNVLSTGVVEKILSWAKFKQESAMAKSCSGAKRSRLTGVPKLDDANMAGTRQSAKATLILTEGDSAKALAVSGLSVVGRDYYGVFPLRGKLLNVREASMKQIMDNAEVQSIVNIMGLKYGQKYESTASLRYGSLMIMTDQDHDGSHIKGLLINFVHHFWPSLLKVPGFLVEFITPIVKVTKGVKTESFYTMPEYTAWKEATGDSGKGWKIKYYKGLGTSTPAEAKQYFADMERHNIAFEWLDNLDDQKIQLAFSKKQTDDRKDWLMRHRPGTFIDQTQETIRYADFIDKELILFSMADNARSIPSVVDGLKPGQRKIMFSCFKRKLKEEIKVAQLAGYVSEHSAYHHGEMSLTSTIINLAQDFVGSNNMGLLVPAGQFGTRLQGGKDAASPRYVFTKLSPLARKVFHVQDDALMKYLDDDGLTIEPEFYVPVIPMVLVNGSDGIGTGWSTSIPNHNPRDIIANIRRMLDGVEPTQMDPWWQGFVGDVLPQDPKNTKFSVHGKIEKTSETTVEITELPVRTWTQPYKEWLETCVQGTDKNPAFVRDYTEYHTDSTVHFVVTMDAQVLAAAEKDTGGLLKKFKLLSTVGTSNMVLFDERGGIKKYATPLEILKDFYDLRLNYYHKRKAYLADMLTDDFDKLDNKVRFIRAVISGDVKVNNVRKKDILADLMDKGYKQFSKKTKDSEPSEDSVETEDGPDTSAASDGYDYLLGMALWSLTQEKINALEKEREAKETELGILLSKNARDLWVEDLGALEEEMDRYAEVVKAQAEKDAGQVTKLKKQPKKRAPKKKTITPKEEDDWQPSKPAARKMAVPKKVIKSEQTKATLEDDQPQASAIKPKRPTARKTKPRSTIVPDSNSDSDSDGGVMLSLSQRLAMTKAPKKEPAPRQRQNKTPVTKKYQTVISDEDLDLDEDEHGVTDLADSVKRLSVGKPGKRPSERDVPRTVEKKKTVRTYSEDSDENSEAECDTIPKSKAKAKAPAKPRAKAAPKAKAKAKTAAAKAAVATVPALSDSDDNLDFEIPVKRAPTSRRAAAKVKYNYESDPSSEGDDSDGSEFEL